MQSLQPPRKVLKPPNIFLIILCRHKSSGCSPIALPCPGPPGEGALLYGICSLPSTTTYRIGNKVRPPALEKL